MVPLFRFLVPLLVLLSPPRVSQEIEVTTPVLEPVANATHPAVASDGRDFLLVWKSLATTTFTLTAARLTGDGSLLDPVGFALARETENAAWMAPPEVLWMQGRYFVTSPGMPSIGILAVEDNQVVAERTLAAIPTGVEHRAATNGTRVLVAWDGGQGAIVDRDLNLIRSLTISGTTVEAVAALGSEFVVFSGAACAGADCPHAILADRFTADGELVSTRTALALPNRIDALAATRAGDRLLVFARIRRPVAEDFWAGSLEAFTVDASGQSAGDAFTILANAPTVNRLRATTDSTGNANLVLETTASSIIARVDAAAHAMSVTSLESEPQAALAFSSASTVLFTGDNSPWNATLKARFVDASLRDDPSRRTSVPVTVAATAQDWPLAQSNGHVYLVTWTETEGRVTTCRGAILSDRGTPIGQPFDLALFPTGIASDGTNFLVVGRYGSSVLAQRVSPSGTVLDSEPRLVSGSYSSQTAVVWNGSNYVVFTSGAEGSDGPHGHVDAIRLDREGNVLDTTAISPRTNAQVSTLAASSGDRTLVVWRDIAVSGTCPKFCTRNVRVDGVMLDRENRIVGTPSLSAGLLDAALSPVSLSFGGGRFLLAWYQATDAREARMVEISTGGVVEAERVVGGPLAVAPAAAWNGAAFDTVWLEETADDTDLAFQRGAGERILLDSPGSERAFSVAAIERSSTLIAYTRRTNDHVHGSTVRLFVRVAPFASARKTRAVRQ